MDLSAQSFKIVCEECGSENIVPILTDQMNVHCDDCHHHGPPRGKYLEQKR